MEPPQARVELDEVVLFVVAAFSAVDYCLSRPEDLRPCARRVCHILVQVNAVVRTVVVPTQEILVNVKGTRMNYYDRIRN